MTRPLSRRAMALGLAAAPFPAFAQKAAALSAADQALVSQAAVYLEGLTEAKARFVQTDARGRTTQGTVYLKRPGKARFAYEPPSGLLVVADGNFVSVADSRLKTFDKYPLMTTPLSLFLARRIKLDRNVVVTRVARLSDGFSITARDGGKNAEGQITLNFASEPVRLIGWSVSDAQGGATRVRLTGLAPASLDPALFVLKDPRQPAPGRARM